MEYFNFDDAYFNIPDQNSSLEQPNRSYQSHLDHPLDLVHSWSSSTASEGNSPSLCSDYSFDATLKFIGEILLEEEQDVIERKSLPLPDSLALRDKEKSFHDVLGQNHIFNESYTLLRGKKNRHGREELGYGDQEAGRGNKRFALYSGDSAPSELLDQVLLYDGDREDFNAKAKGHSNLHIKANEEIVADLWTLMTQCAQAVARYDQRSATDHLNQLRRRASPRGDATQRLAHYVADGLEARLSGARTASYTPLVNHELSPADILRAYEVFIAACPFFRTSFSFANSAIRKLASAAEKLHIIDFGILYGFQWPGLIQRLSQRPGGPPRLRITGIEFPQPGFRPGERAEETKRRLESYSKRFGVPAECKVIARRWEAVRYEELGIEEGELVVVNCLYRMRHAAEGSPRDDVLRLIRRINPEVFIHGVVSGAYGGAEPFETRFREALRHYAGLFDMFEATVGREDPHRMMFERAIYGRDIANVLACEGSERVERPETYVQWQARNERAGFRQIPLDREIVEALKRTVGLSYNKGFTVEQHGHWLLQGWKEQRLYALSCWKPAY